MSKGKLSKSPFNLFLVAAAADLFALMRAAASTRRDCDLGQNADHLATATEKGAKPPHKKTGTVEDSGYVKA
jgi:hypothetical protein